MHVHPTTASMSERVSEPVNPRPARVHIPVGCGLVTHLHNIHSIYSQVVIIYYTPYKCSVYAYTYTINTYTIHIKVRSIMHYMCLYMVHVCV